VRRLSPARWHRDPELVNADVHAETVRQVIDVAAGDEDAL
jgi:hypothetical protein